MFNSAEFGLGEDSATCPRRIAFERYLGARAAPSGGGRTGHSACALHIHTIELWQLGLPVLVVGDRDGHSVRSSCLLSAARPGPLTHSTTYTALPHPPTHPTLSRRAGTKYALAGYVHHSPRSSDGSSAGMLLNTGGGP